MDMGVGRPMSLARMGLTVFFPVPGVPADPYHLAHTGSGGPGLKRALWPQEAFSI